MIRKLFFMWLVLSAIFTLESLAVSPIVLDVNLDKEIAVIQPDMYGVFFEDINFGADGGLYAELIKNRSFDFPHPLVGWVPFGDVRVMSEDPCFDKNPNYVRLELKKGSLTGSGLDNEGFTGIGFQKGTDYRLVFYARVINGEDAKMRFECVTSRSENPDVVEVELNGSTWKKYSVIITPTFTDANSRLRLRLISDGTTVDVEHVSLFPVDTWQGRENGMRRDLAQALFDLNPGVFRFPGGCIVEGTILETRYQWKNSVGPVENRPININRWNYTFRHKFFPDYFQSYGLGFYEYFLLSEDLGAEPLPVISCGIACQYETGELVEIGDLQPYIDDALDLIEFANGSPSSTWGKVRAEMGHPEPFNLKYIGIGNEQWGEVYPERLELFVKAIREKYPKMLIVGSSGPSAEGTNFEYLWPEMKRINVDLVDEHYYKPPAWFLANAGRYDNYDRKGPKVFAGEYAAHDGSRGNANNFNAALSEAAFMTGLERNADIVHLATYAPLFAHINAHQWGPDLIWFDNLNVLRTPSYYVQKLYGHNSGTHVIQITSENSDLKGENNLYATAALDKDNSEIVIKVVNTGSERENIQINLNGRKWKFAGRPEITTLQSDDLYAVNEIGKERVSPVTGWTAMEDGNLHLPINKYSFSIVRIKYSK